MSLLLPNFIIEELTEFLLLIYEQIKTHSQHLFYCIIVHIYDIILVHKGYDFTEDI